MVSATFILLFALCDAQIEQPMGVLRVARGGVNLGRGVELRPASAGDVLTKDTVIETDADGWTELELVPAGRIRLSAGTHLEIERKNDQFIVNLESGRVWVAHTGRDRALEVITPNTHASVPPLSSTIIEYARASGTAVAVREGEATLAISTETLAPVRILRGQIATAGTDATTIAPARSGGQSLAEIVLLEAKTSLGDLIGVKAFLLARVLKAKVKGFDARGIQEIVRTDPEITGGDAGPAGSLVESGKRPPPFFENEVPPRGPNVRVRVTYGE